MRVTSIAGVPVSVHPTLTALAVVGVGASLVGEGPEAALTTLGLGSLLAMSVVLHELGHALAARSFGIGTRDITLYPFGGVASLERMPRVPAQEVAIALAGPAVNLALAVLGALAWGLFGGIAPLALAAMNVVMGVFNLVPAFPMDGGRVLRASLAHFRGHLWATDVAIRVGRAAAWVFVVAGLLGGGWSLTLVGGFLLLALRVERAQLSAELRALKQHGRGVAVAWRLNPPPGSTGRVSLG